jgi:hypothetical protein
MEFIQDLEHALWMSDDHHKFRILIKMMSMRKSSCTTIVDFIKKNKEMVTLSGGSNMLLDTKAHSSTLILTIRGPGAMC